MWTGAALAVVEALSGLLTRDRLRVGIEDALHRAGQSVSATTIDTATTVSLVTTMVLGLLGAGLWLLMAWANGRGMSWARILSSVFFAVDAIAFVADLVQGTTALAGVLSALVLLVGAAAIWLLWRKDSSSFYDAVSLRDP